jgi:putative salt-induced outer membrane protein YdiY
MGLFYARLCWIGITASIAISCLADTVTLDNGDRLSGTILRREHGKLVIKTSYSGEVKIDLKRIRNLQSDKPKTVVLDNEKRLYGKVSGDGTAITVQPTDQSAPRREPTATVSNILPGIVTGREWNKKGHINIGWSNSSGNTDVTRLHTDAETIAQRGKDRYTAGAVVNYATDQHVESESNALAYAKYDRFFTPKWYAYLNTNLEHDKFRDIRVRGVVGFGSGWQAIATKRTNLALEGGLGYVFADLYDAPNEEFPTVRLALRYDHYLIPEKVQFFQKTEGYVSLGSVKNSFARAATGFRFHLHDNFIATTEYDVNWDGEPTPGSVSTDQIMLFTLGYKW